MSYNGLMEKSFICEHCGLKVPTGKFMGTLHRNQCPFCLWSKHVDLKIPGDRKSGCLGAMEPVGLTFKQKGTDKYGRPRQGELMVVHRCLECGKYSINRVAADDDPKAILTLFEKSLGLPAEIRVELTKQGIRLLDKNDKAEIRVQLFGKS